MSGIFHPLHLEDYSSEPIRATGDDSTALLHTLHVGTGRNSHDIFSNVCPGPGTPGTKLFRHHRGIYYKFLPLSETLTGANVLVFIVQIFISNPG